MKRGNLSPPFGKGRMGGILQMIFKQLNWGAETLTNWGIERKKFGAISYS